ATMNFGGTWTIQSFAMGSCTASTTGCIFDNSGHNNNSTVTALGNAFNISGTGTRTVKLGTSTITLSGTGPTFNAGTATNLTYTGNTGSTISFTGTTGKTLSSPNLTHGTVSATGSTDNRSLTFNGSFTITALTLDNNQNNHIIIPGGLTLTVTNAIAIQG